MSELYDHDHDHAHENVDPHAQHPEHHRPSTYHERLTAAVLDLLVEKDVLSPAEITAQITSMEQRSPANGARVVARAWIDPAYKTRLLKDANAAVRELGMEPGAFQLLVVENTPEVHNVIVCTLCSCYPKGLLGIPPAWYKSKAYRARTVREPRAVLAEFGLHIEPNVTVRVHDSTADMRYIVLPVRPAGTEGWGEERLATLVTRDAMIGVARAREPVAV